MEDIGTKNYDTIGGNYISYDENNITSAYIYLLLKQHQCLLDLSLASG